MITFKQLPVQVLFHMGYWDGPTSGMCSYNNEILYFTLKEELEFPYPSNILPEDIKDEDDKRDFHGIRIYSLYKLPNDVTEALLYNHDLAEQFKCKAITQEQLDQMRKQLPDWMKVTHKSFNDVGYQYAVGYTTTDIWNNKEYLKKRHKDLDKVTS